MPFKGLSKSPSFFATGQIHLQILSEIFVRWAHVDDDAPWKASTVCRLWRSAVLSTPEAWSRVTVLFPVAQMKQRKKAPRKGPNVKKAPWEEESDSQSSTSDAESEKAHSDEEDDEEDSDEHNYPLRPLTLWLSRAGKFELFVHMNIGIAPRTDLIYEAFHLLSPHFQKLKEFYLVVESSILSLDQVLNMFTKPMPVLEHLSLSTVVPRIDLDGRNSERLTVMEFWNFLRQTSRLRSLTLSKCLRLGPMPTPLVGRHRHLAIQTLTLDDAHTLALNTLLKMIEPFLGLETLIFTSNIDCLTTLTTSDYPITLPALTSLTVGDEIYMLASLTLPKLQTLILDKKMPKDGRQGLLGLLSDLFERGTDLRSLTISFAPLPDHKFSQILRHIPTLVALELRHCSVQMQSLIQTTSGINPLCPRLQDLRLSAARPVSRHYDSGHCQLQLHPNYIDNRDIEKLRKAGGATLQIEYVPYTED
ncbi:hypothetical protein DFH06DRAFT_1331528 [Mycena polygramma]|nr:hypothetical protein DFH06DRAFT_1331528 [Mycena polygramma]